MKRQALMRLVPARKPAGVGVAGLPYSLRMSTPPSPAVDDPRFLRLMDDLESTTARPSIEISTDSVGPLPVSASKLGGTPYLPAGEPAPQGRVAPLTFLAQIRLEELPDNDFLPDAGLLQFWIGRDDLYGMECDDLRAGDYRVVHYPSVEESVSEEDVLARYVPANLDDEDELSPFETNDSLALSFTMTSQPLSKDDVSFGKAFSDLWSTMFPEVPLEAWWKLPKDLTEALYDRFATSGHRLGGYPCFTQWDPRGTNALEKEAVLLLQIDSDDHIMWGDVGVANFFILPQELAAGDFSRVAYTWDCC